MKGNEMAYFLKKTKNKKGTYLQIYESFYDPIRKHTAHKSYKAIGYVEELKKKGYLDPESYFKEEVTNMNEKRKLKIEQAKNIKEIGDESPEKNLGYFLIKAVDKTLNVDRDLRYLDMMTTFKFSLPNLLHCLVYARFIQPASKHRTFHDVLPKLSEEVSFSSSQLYSGLEFLGENYEKVIEVYNRLINEKFTRNTAKSYFDCTNFYFEIDKEDDFRRKGPSKENKKDPIVGMGLLLDENQIPIGMKMYPGNESEKPKMKQIIDELKEQYNISDRTIRVADKGLNCADNVVSALLDGDGYIFSKSIKQIPQIDKDWVFDEQSFKCVYDKAGRLRYKFKSVIDEFDYQITDEKNKKKKVSIKEKRVVTYNPALAKKQLHEINKMISKSRGLCLSQAKKAEFGECAKFVTFSSKNRSDKVVASLNYDAIDKARMSAGYNMLVTSEIDMRETEIYDAYHNLWRIEESFKIMKSDLDARPVYLQKESTITGHFLVCYIAVLLLRLLQFKILDNQFSSGEIINFIKTFNVVKTFSTCNINLLKKSDFASSIQQYTYLPIKHFYLKETSKKSILGYKFTEKYKVDKHKKNINMKIR